MKPLTLVLLLLTLSGCSSDVVDDFTETCPEFFANPEGIRSAPTVFKGKTYRQICQILDNKYEFATLYDTAKRIPIYSAYRFEGIRDCKRKSHWRIEPELDNRASGERMGPDRKNKALPNQAVNEDYKGTHSHGYEKGHLVPVYHARSQSCSDATFTLTNAAPQYYSFNQVQWRNTEFAVAKYLVQSCLPNSAYIVTGVVPGHNTLKNRVRIPSHFWTAYCCLDNNLKVNFSRGFLGENMDEAVQQMSVKSLDRKLSELYSMVFRVFGGRCN